MKKTFKFCTIGDEERWRVEIIKGLADVKQGPLEIKNDDQEGLPSKDEIQEIIDFVVTT